MWVRQRSRVGRDRVARTERAIVRLHALILASLGIVALVSAGGPSSPALVWVSSGLWIVVASDLVVRGERPVHLLALGAALAAGSWAQADVVPGALPSGAAVGVLGLSAARLVTALAFAATMAAAAATSIGITALARPTVLLTTVDDAVLSVSMALAIRILLRMVDDAAVRQRDADLELARAREAEVHAAAARVAAERAARALHDDVLTALRGIASGWPEDVVRRDARRAVESIAGAATATDRDLPDARQDAGTITTLVREIVAHSPLDLDVVVHGDLRSAVLTSESGAALVRAAGEALRNAERHGGVRSAMLRIVAAPEELELVVIDHGIGPRGGIVAGFGLESSIRAPLARLGGTARFEETPGGGLTVTMALPLGERPAQALSRLSETYYATTASSIERNQVTDVILPIVAAYTYIGARNSGAWDQPVLSWLLLLGFTAVSVVATGRLRTGAPTRWWVAGVVLGLVLLTAIGLAGAPSGAMLDFRGWPVGYAAVVVALLLLVLPARVGVAVLAPLPVLVVVAQRIDPSLSDGATPWSAVNAALMLPLGLMAVGGMLRRVGRRVEADLSRAADLWWRDAARGSAAWVAEVHLAHTRERVSPWLEAVAEGAVPVAHSEAVATARSLALEVRDDLYAPGFFTDELRLAVRRFRRDGGQVRIRASDGSEPPARGAGPVVRELVHRLGSDHCITLSFGTGSDGSWRLVAVPPIPEVEDWLGGTCRAVSDADRTVIESREGVPA